MGVVWKAWDEELGREVAVKQLRPRSLANEESLQRFLREARLAARLRHPHILGVFDVGTHADGPFIIMQYVPGRTLADRWRESRASRAGAAGTDEAALRPDVALLARVCEAVGHAHREGIVHRDLKPGNVLLGADDHPWVSDFGLAKDLQVPGGSEAAQSHRMRDLTLDGQVLGTPGYMSPEQVDGNPAAIGPHSDVWALGVMLYEILTGRLPFGESNDLSDLYSVLSREPEAPGTANPRAPRELSAVCMKALRKEPADRYPDAARMAEDLGRWLRGERVQVSRPDALARLRTWARRHRTIAGAAGATLLVLLASLAWGWSARERARDRTREILENIARSVESFSEEVRRTPLTPEARTALAQQSLGLLADFVRDAPGQGAAISWRGRVLEALGQRREALADYDRGCALSPEQAVVWYLRGMHYIDRFAASRALPDAQPTPFGVDFAPSAEETPEQREWRERGLADLDRMAAIARLDRSLDEDRLRIGRATIAAYAGRRAGYEEAVASLAGLDSPRACWLRGLCCYHLQRFEDAAAEFRRVVSAWPENVPTLEQAGNAFYALAMVRRARGEDPQLLCREAIRTYEGATQRNPDSVLGHCGRGVACWRLGRELRLQGSDPSEILHQAKASLTRCLELSPGLLQALGNRGLVHHELGNVQAAAGTDPVASYRAALADFDAALQTRIATNRSLLNRGVVLTSLGTWLEDHGQESHPVLRQAIESYQAALAVDAEDPVIHANLAQAFRQLAESLQRSGQDGREAYERSITCADEALKRRPEYVEAHNHRAMSKLGLAKCRIARGEEAADLLRSAVQDSSAALRNNARLPALFNTRANIQQTLARVVARSGGDPRAHLHGAIDDYASALAINPNYATGYHNRALLREDLVAVEERLGADPIPGLEEAIRDLDAAIRCNAGYGNALLQRGRIGNRLACLRGARGEDPRPGFERAIADLGRAIDLNPGRGGAWLERGAARMELGRIERASGREFAEYERAAEADLRVAVERGEGEAYLRLGELCRVQGRWGEAIEAYRACVRAAPASAGWVESRVAGIRRAQRAQAEPGSWAARFLRAEKALRAGDRSAAREGFEQSLALLDTELAGLSEQDRRERWEEEGLGESSLQAHVALARLLATASTGDGAAPPPEESATRLRDEAFRHLEAAIALGWRDRATAASDPDLASLHGDPRWSQKIEGGR